MGERFIAASPRLDAGLLIACVNVTDLQLGRADARRREIAVPMARRSGTTTIASEILLLRRALGDTNAYKSDHRICA